MAVDIGPKIGIDGEKEFREQLNKINTSLKTLGTEAKKVTSEFQNNGNSQEALKKKNEVLNKTIDEQKKKLEMVQKALDESKKEYGETSTKTMQWQQVLNRTETTLNNLEAELGENEKALKEWKNSIGSGNKALEELSAAAEKFGNKAIETGKTLTKYLTTAILGVGTAAGKSAMSLDDGYDIIITKTGATGEALHELQNVADNVFSDMPTDMSKVGIAVGEINTRFGVTGKALEKLSQEFLMFAQINEIDLNDSIGKIDKIMEQFNVDISKTPDLLGLITKRAQETGIGVDTLLDSVQKNGATFKEMGLNVEKSVNLLAQFEANGVNAETALMGLKKSITNYASAGLSANEALEKTINSIKNARTETEALNIAQEVFGTRGAVEMTAAIRDGRISIDDLSDSMSNYKDIVANTFSETQDPWDKAKILANNLKEVLKELGNTIFEILNPVIEKAVEKIKTFSKWFRNLNDSTKKMIVYIGGIASAIGPLLIVTGKITKMVSSVAGDLSKTNSVIKKTIAVITKTTSTTATMTSATTASAAATTGASTAFKSLWSIISGNPVATLVTSLTALGLALGAAAIKAAEANSETGKLKAEMRVAAAEIDEYKKKMSELSEQRNETISEGESEIIHLKTLKAELDEIVDSNGKVKAGYEERATFITSTLSDALGQEITITDGVIAKYDELSGAIDKATEKEKARQYISAYEAEYQEALKNEQRLLENVLTAQENLTKAEKELNDIKTTDSLHAQQTARDNYIKAKKDLEKFTGEYTKNHDVIKKSEEMMKAFMSENYDEVYKIAYSAQTNITNMSRSETKKQIEDLKLKREQALKLCEQEGDETARIMAENYSEEIAILENHLNSMNSSVRNNAAFSAAIEEMINDGKKKIKKDSWKQPGASVVEGLAEGIRETAWLAYDAATGIVNGILSTFQHKLIINSPSKLMRDKIGTAIPEGIAKGEEKGLPFIKKANESIVKEIRNINIPALNQRAIDSAGYALASVPSMAYTQNEPINITVQSILDGKIVSESVQRNITKNQVGRMRVKGVNI